MRSLKDYVDTFRDIALNLNLQGDSVEMIVQLLANAVYISEVENIKYTREASLESCMLTNSKIQHSMDLMHSIHRGTCPRVIMNFTSGKYVTYEMYEEIASTSNFKLYYIGYFSEEEQEFKNTSCTIRPETEYKIMCLISRDAIERTWTLTSDNMFYVDCEEDNLSNDIYVEVKLGSDTNGVFGELKTTTSFSDHILNNEVFDLTITGLGSRLFVPDEYRMANTEIRAKFFKYSELGEFNLSELKSIKINGFNLNNFSDDFYFITRLDPDFEYSKGLLFLDSTENETLDTIHYKANQDRYVNSMMRSNSDLGALLEKTYPNKIKSGGTSCSFVGNNVKIYYVPYNELNPDYLTLSEIERYVSKDSSRRAYYITDNITIEQGIRYEARFSFDLTLYKSTSVTDEINEILATYSGKFNTDIENSRNEIISLLSKISNIKSINNMNISYISITGEPISLEDYSSLDLKNTYFYINPNSTEITTTL